MVLKLVRLVGSAFVISVAEELFFRRFLMRFAGFWWMVLLFAVEHDRWLVGAFAGLLYGWLALRKGLLSAIVAHVVTNLALGLYVLETKSWQFW
jgi:CAAX prenyl protease-like protein